VTLAARLSLALLVPLQRMQWGLRVMPPAQRASKARSVHLAVHLLVRALAPAQRDLRVRQEIVWNVCPTHTRVSRGAPHVPHVVRIMFRDQGKRPASVLLDLRVLIVCAQYALQTRPRLRVALRRKHVCVCWGILREEADGSSARQENMEQGRVRAQAAPQQHFPRQRARRAMQHVGSVMGTPIHPLLAVLLLPAGAIRATLESTAPAATPAMLARTRH